MNSIDESVIKVVRLLEKIPHNYDEITQRTPYYNMGATITDSVLQAGMNYSSVVYPRVLNILKKYSDYKTTCDFIILFQAIPIEEIIQWKNQRKQKTICELSWFLYNNGVNTEGDLAEWLKNNSNKEMTLKIKGVGRKTVDYLKLLSGGQAIPIDRHMFQFLKMAGVYTSDYNEASRIMCKTASFLKIGESALDRIVWKHMSNCNVEG